MKKVKDIFKFLGITVLILAITVGIPSYLYLKYQNTQYYSMVPFEQNGNVPSTFANIANLIKSGANPTYLQGLVRDYSNILAGKSHDLANLFLAVSLMFGISLITLGAVWHQKNKHMLPWALMASGTISIVVYILIYVLITSLLGPIVV